MRPRWRFTSPPTGAPHAGHLETERWDRSGFLQLLSVRQGMFLGSSSGSPFCCITEVDSISLSPACERVPRRLPYRAPDGSDEFCVRQYVGKPEAWGFISTLLEVPAVEVHCIVWVGNGWCFVRFPFTSPKRVPSKKTNPYCGWTKSRNTLNPWKPIVVYRGIILPKFLGWRRISSTASRADLGEHQNKSSRPRLYAAAGGGGGWEPLPAARRR